MQVRKFTFLIIISLLLGCISACNNSQEGPLASRDGQQIHLKSSDITFEIPLEWIKWHDKFSNNLHLTAEELEAVQEGAGEWDTEFGLVVNRVLPFDRCAVHVGGEGWGNEGAAFSDMQVRVYMVDQTLAEIENVIKRDGVAAVKEITGREIAVERDDTDGWRKNTLTFSRYYYDYGATAHVDFRLRRFEDQTVVVVLMYTDYQSQEADILFILNSFN